MAFVYAAGACVCLCVCWLAVWLHTKECACLLFVCMEAVVQSSRQPASHSPTQPLAQPFLPYVGTTRAPCTAFALPPPGTVTVHRAGGDARIIPVNTTVGRSGSVLVTFKAASSVPPYRIENRTKSVVVMLRQQLDTRGGSGSGGAAGEATATTAHAALAGASAADAGMSRVASALSAAQPRAKDKHTTPRCGHCIALCHSAHTHVRMALVPESMPTLDFLFLSTVCHHVLLFDSPVQSHH